MPGSAYAANRDGNQKGYLRAEAASCRSGLETACCRSKLKTLLGPANLQLPQVRVKHRLVSRELLSWQPQHPTFYTLSAETGGTVGRWEHHGSRLTAHELSLQVGGHLAVMA